MMEELSLKFRVSAYLSLRESETLFCVSETLPFDFLNYLAGWAVLWISEGRFFLASRGDRVECTHIVVHKE